MCNLQALKCALSDLPPSGYTWTCDAADAIMAESGSKGDLFFENMGTGEDGMPLVNLLYSDDNQELQSINAFVAENFLGYFW